MEYTAEWLERISQAHGKKETHDLRIENATLRSILRDLWEKGVVPPTLECQVRRMLDLSA